MDSQHKNPSFSASKLLSIRQKIRIEHLLRRLAQMVEFYSLKAILSIWLFDCRPLWFLPRFINYLLIYVPFIDDQGLIWFIVVLDQIKYERFYVIPVSLFFLWYWDEILAVKNSSDPLHFEKSSRKGWYIVSILERDNIDRILSSHDNFGGGNKF